MSYRDELNAAHQRIAALEQELAARDGETQPEPSEPPARLRDEEAAILESSPTLRAMLAASRARAPIMQRQSPTKRIEIPLLFSTEGGAGETGHAIYRSHTMLKPLELFAFDTSTHPGHGTVIERIFFGADAQPFERVPTWMFYEWVPEDERVVMRATAKLNGTKHETAETRAAAARLRIAEAAGRLDWRQCYPGLDITFSVKFREACKWEAVLWCAEIR